MYSYTLIDLRGRRKKGFIRLEDEGDALRRLEQDGGHVLELTEVASGSEAGQAGKLKIPSGELSVFYRLTARMFQARLPALKVFQTLRAQARSWGLRTVLDDLADGLQKGKNISAVLEGYPSVFPPVVRALVKSGERGGHLAEAFHAVWELSDSIGRLKKKLAAVLIYPSLVLAFSFGVLLVVVLLLIPRFAELYADLGAPLPLATRFLFDLSRMLSVHPWIWILPPSCLAGLYLFFRKHWRRMLRRIPFVGELLRCLESSRITFGLALLLRQGMTPDRAVELIAGGTDAPDSESQIRFRNAVASIRAGGGLASALDSTGILDSVGLQLVAGGEGSGQMEEMLSAVAALEWERFETQTSVLLAILQPVLILLVGLVIGGMILAVFLPVFSAVNYI